MAIMLLGISCVILLVITLSFWKKARQYEAERDALQLKYDALDKQLQTLRGAEIDAQRLIKLA